MNKPDAQRWNQRYAAGSKQLSEPCTYLTQHMDMLPSIGRVLDIAMGTGRNTIFMRKVGYTVVGADISHVAIQTARSFSPVLPVVLADMKFPCFKHHAFDICINFYFLERSLFQYFENILRPGGVLVLETLLKPMKEIRPDIPDEYLLQEGELKEAFQHWKILDYREGWIPSDHGYQKSVASLIARLP